MAATAKKTSTKKTATKKTKGKQTKAGQHAQKQMWAVVLFAVGILLGAIVFIKGDKLWFSLHSTFFGLMGWSAYFLPPLVIYIAVIAAMDKPLSSIKAKLWQAAALMVMISGAIQIFGPGLPSGATFVENLASLYEGGQDLTGGGVASIILAGPLVALFAKSGASIIIVLAIIVFSMLVTGTTLISLFKWAVSPMQSLKEDYEGRLDSRREKEATRQVEAPPKRPKSEKNKNISIIPSGIDIDISGDSDPDPLEAPSYVRRTSSVSRQAIEDEPETVIPAALSAVAVADKDDLPVGEEIIPGHPVITDFHGAAAGIKEWDEPDEDGSIDRLVAAAGVSAGIVKSIRPPEPDRPVEYISPEEFIVKRDISEIIPEPVEEPEEIHHPLDDDIFDALLAESGLDGVRNWDDIYNDDQDLFISETAAIKPEPDLGQKPADSGEAPVAPAASETAASGIQKQNGFTAATAVEIPPKEYKYPPESLLKPSKAASNEDITEELRSNAQTLVDTLKSFGVQTRITDICRGPAVTRYELQPSAGVKISKITGLSDDIALNLAAAGIRIEAPIPNKAAVGIEVPNKVVSMVSIRDLLDTNDFKRAPSSVTVALGKDIAGNNMLADIAKMPHLLIAGATGSGKSVCINTIIISLLYKSSPDDVKLLMIDPKVVELGVYNGIPHLLIPVVTDPKKAAGALGWAVTEMENRYRTFAEHGVRDLAGFNRVAKSRSDLSGMPTIVMIIDELADLMMTAPNEVEDSICRLAQKARAAGMHLVIATQRPSVDVITGVIKANIPSRIAFSVSSQTDSRTILDMGGAEKLLGRGDMLFSPVGAAKPIRVQGCFVADSEVESVVSYIMQGEEADYDQEIVEEIGRFAIPEKGNKDKDKDDGFDGEDEMLPLAIECVVEAGQASTSQLQRRLKLGYARAARIIDELEQRGIVGPFEGSKPRQVLLSYDRWMEMKLNK